MARSDKARPRKLGKVGRNVIDQIGRSKSNDLSRLIYALGIRHVGEKAAATLARYFRNMDAILDAPVERLQTAPEIGPVVAASVRAFAEEPSFVHLLGTANVGQTLFFAACLAREALRFIRLIELRVAGMQGMSKVFTATAKSKDAVQAGNLLSVQGRRLVASDIVWSDLFKSAAKPFTKSVRWLKAGAKSLSFSFKFQVAGFKLKILKPET